MAWCGRRSGFAQPPRRGERTLSPDPAAGTLAGKRGAVQGRGHAARAGGAEAGRGQADRRGARGAGAGQGGSRHTALARRLALPRARDTHPSP